MRKVLAFKLVIGLGIFCSCSKPPALLPLPQAPAVGYWFDHFRARRAQLSDPELIAGSARVKLTPTNPWVRIAGHGHFRKHSKGVLDDIYARVLYLDSGREAVVLCSVDFIGLMLPRVERIRSLVTRKYPGVIIIAATHNHAGPDTEGLWGPALFGLLPVRSGIDKQYMARVERRVSRAILRAVATARPARLLLGRFEAPEGLAVNMREPDDVPRQVTILRAADENGLSIGTVINYANHAEALQDKNRWLSADWPGVLCREVDLALGGVSLFFSGPAGGMLEPANHPDDPEAQRLAFREHLGATLARGVILQAIGGMKEIRHPQIRRYRHRFELPIQAEGLVSLAMSLRLLEPRLVENERLQTEVDLIDLNQLQIISIPGEITPEVGRAIARQLDAEYRMIVTLGNDHLAYMISERQWQDPRFGYEREMSLGPETTSLMLQAVKKLTSLAR